MRYTNVDVLASVAARVGWARHLPAALALLALAALLIALGRPERTVAAEQRQATVVMVTDTSGSMLAKDVHPDRLTAAKDAGARAGRQAAARLPARPGRLRHGRLAAGRADDRQGARERWRSTRSRSRGKTAMGDGLALGLDAARSAR